MPEELKPCPICGENMNLMVMKNNHPIAADKPYYIQCGNGCLCAGPTASATADAAITAWNALPRAPHITPNDVDCKGCPERRPGLAWTTEPPTVPGWYWWRWHKGAEAIPLEVREGLIVEYPRRTLRAVADIGGQWAGPIPMPKDEP